MIQANKEQLLASNPMISAWVAASAGSGKTKVLTDRVLNLMLMTGEPEKILCLTFTKVAAAEMLHRLTEILKRWTTLSTDELSQEIKALNPDNFDENILSRARGLFAKVLEAPGGLKMMTIHSFCTSILHRFPLEANVPPNFKVLEELSTQKLIQQALNKVLDDKTIIRDIQFLATFISQENLINTLTNVLGQRADLYQIIHKFNGLDGFIQHLKELFTLTSYQNEKEIIAQHFHINEWPIVKELYLTKTGQIRKRVKDPHLAQLAYEVNEKLKSWQIIQLNHALFKLVFQILEVYQNEKFKLSALDYDDLINKTRDLFSNSDTTAWVLYKLDGGIDHILVDEAQDTNPKQWEIIRALADDFFTGETRTEHLRTLFVVGDKKQSIYSFQGARPDEFEQQHQFFHDKILTSQNDFQTIPFNFSFRSTRPILDLVNQVLNNPNASKGVINPNEDVTHLSKRPQDAGLVEIWPIETPPEVPDTDSWLAQNIVEEHPSAMRVLSKKIAKKIAHMINQQEILPAKGRPVQAGDFLILLQKRGQFMEELVRALKEQNVPVAGVDRLNLTEHIAIKDLMALIRFVLLPSDDLNLACLLKSPLVGLNEDDLYALCHNRGIKTVWERLQDSSPPQATTLKQIMNLADQVPPFEFLQIIYNEYHARQKFMARLGIEVNEALDALLDLALQYESEEPPSLQGFIDLLSKQKIVIKRDMDQKDINAVRIMTVHGSKGLQGNIVFLPDTRGKKAIFQRLENLIWIKNCPLWVPQKEITPDCVNTIFQQMDDLNQQEKNRLLYVALTRAADQLYICGYDTKTKAQENNWYDLIQKSLHLDSINKIVSFSSPQECSTSSKPQIKLPHDFDVIPDWVQTEPTLDISDMILHPSTLIKHNDTTDTVGVQNALERGTIIHKLLQHLATIPTNERTDVFKKIVPPDMDISNDLLKIFHIPKWHDLFGSNSMAEVPVIGKINGQTVSGQIDRLIIRDLEVVIVDFKTNKNIPQKTPENYRLQLNMYKDLLKNIFPDKIIRGYIFWTENLSWTEV